MKEVQKLSEEPGDVRTDDIRDYIEALLTHERQRKEAEEAKRREELEAARRLADERAEREQKERTLREQAEAALVVRRGDLRSAADRSRNHDLAVVPAIGADR